MLRKVVAKEVERRPLKRKKVEQLKLELQRELAEKLEQKLVEEVEMIQIT